MTKEELTIWFHDNFYEGYRALIKTPFVTKYSIGSKGEALKKTLQLKPNEALRQRIMQALAEQKKHRSKLFEQCGSMQKYLELTAYNKFYSTRMCSTWLNQMGWEDEIPELQGANEQGVTLFEGRCQKQDCSQPVHGPAFDYCTTCLTKENEDLDLLRNQLRKMDLTLHKGESRHDYAMRCKAVALKTLKGLRYGL